MIDPKQSERIITEETAKFLDSSFGGLDLSGCPSLLHPQPEADSMPDERFAPLDNRGLGLGSTALKDFLRNPGREALTELAKTDPEIATRLESEVAGGVATDFVQRNPDYVRSDRNLQAIVDYLSNKYLRREFEDVEDAIHDLMAINAWNVAELERAYGSLLREGLLEVPSNQPRQLTEHQLRAIALQASSGDIEGAATRFLQLRLPENIADELLYCASLEEMLDRIADPDLQNIVAESVWFSWEQGRPNYSPTTERRRFLQQYVAGRIPTARLLDEACAHAKSTSGTQRVRAYLAKFEIRKLKKPHPLTWTDFRTAKSTTYTTGH